MVIGNKNLITSGVTEIRGEEQFTTNGNFTVPAGVESICIIVVGGGGGGKGLVGGNGGNLAYINNVAVVPGEIMPITVGAGGFASTSLSSTHDTENPSIVKSPGLSTIITSASNLGGSTWFSGGLGGDAFKSMYVEPGPNYVQNGGGGGGAGGYSGSGGDGGQGDASGKPVTEGQTGAGGGGGGGGISTDATPTYSSSGGYYFGRRGAPGGGVNVFGSGANGAGGANSGANPYPGGGGSGGTAGVYASSSGVYGGGGGGGYIRIYDTGVYKSASAGLAGGIGTVRILWGEGRSFPSTDVGVS